MKNARRLDTKQTWWAMQSADGCVARRGSPGQIYEDSTFDAIWQLPVIPLAAALFLYVGERVSSGAVTLIKGSTRDH